MNFNIKTKKRIAGLMAMVSLSSTFSPSLYASETDSKKQDCGNNEISKFDKKTCVKIGGAIIGVPLIALVGIKGAKRLYKAFNSRNLDEIYRMTKSENYSAFKTKMGKELSHVICEFIDHVLADTDYFSGNYFNTTICELGDICQKNCVTMGTMGQVPYWTSEGENFLKMKQLNAINEVLRGTLRNVKDTSLSEDVELLIELVNMYIEELDKRNRPIQVDYPSICTPISTPRSVSPPRCFSISRDDKDFFEDPYEQECGQIFQLAGSDINPSPFVLPQPTFPMPEVQPTVNNEDPFGDASVQYFDQIQQPADFDANKIPSKFPSSSSSSEDAE